jgi:hypothetical protein
MAKERKYQIPESILRQLDEMSAGGFMLFTFDAERTPQVHASFDNPTTSLAMQHYIETWVTTIKEMHIDSLRNQFINQSGHSEE